MDKWVSCKAKSRFWQIAFIILVSISLISGSASAAAHLKFTKSITTGLTGSSLIHVGKLNLSFPVLR
jgi:hypothetical protein